MKPSQAVGISEVESRNRQDILDQIEGEEIHPNSIKFDGDHLFWDTTPEELERLAKELSTLEDDDNTYAWSTRASLRLNKPGKGIYCYNYPGLEVRRGSSLYPEGVLTISPRRLSSLGKRLAKADWQRKSPDRDYGADRKVVKARIGDDIVSLIWTPPFDQQGVMQISQMVWDAWWTRTNRNFAQAVEEDRRKERSYFTDPFTRDRTVFGIVQ